MSFKPRWIKVFKSFDPVVPAGDASRPDIVRVERPYTPIAVLARDLAFPEAHRRELIVGAPGSGKSTELLALMRHNTGLRPILVDLREHFQDQRGDVAALDRLRPWEALIVIGLAIYRYGTEHLGHRWSKADTSELCEAIAGPSGSTPAEIDVAQLASEVAVLAVSTGADAVLPGSGLALRALSAVTNSASARLPLGIRRDDPLTDQDPRVRRILHIVSRLLVALAKDYGKPILLLVDGVDRADAQLSRRLFEDSELLAALPCHQVMTAPLSLRQRNLRGAWRSHFLGNIPVLDPSSPLDPGPRCSFFVDLWAARAGATRAEGEPLLTERQIVQLAWASGGLIRVFCEMIQGVARAGWLDDTVATSAIVDHEIDQWRRRWEENLHLRDIETLQAVREARQLIGDDHELALLDQRCIVAWPNDSRWYYPHPLLLLKLLQ